MTLTELLIAVSLVGVIMAVLATSIIVTLRQRDNTEGRLNVARAEQNVSMWIPADLSSADTVDTNPGSTPCGAPVCDGIDLGDGSNVLQLTWTEVLDNSGTERTTSVGYNFFPAGDGTYQVRRVECTRIGAAAWTCQQSVVLRDLPGPPGGEPFVPGVEHGADTCIHEESQPNPAYPGDPTASPTIVTTVGSVACTRPTWVIVVSEPLEPCAGLQGPALVECRGDPNDPGGEVKDANRVVVSINGGGDGEGAGGGVNQISITAGGTVRRIIPADSLLGAPTFVEARSRCGGPITLIIDQSTSIPWGARSQVKGAALEFVQTLRGTPTQIQVVEFDTATSVLADGQSASTEPGWHEYFDMTVDADWQRLETAINNMAFGGDTNWEDALYRTFYADNGTTPQIVPETVVFFTDGVPTVDRSMGSNYRAAGGALQPLPVPYAMPPWPNHSGGVYHQGSYNRAEYIAAKVRAEQRDYVRMIGVGVGGVNDNQRWISDPGAGYKNVWERGYVQYKRIADGWESRVDFEQATTFRSTVDYERRRRWGGSNWTNISPTDFHNQEWNYEYRINGTRSSYGVTETEYDLYRSDSPSNYSIHAWADRTPDQYHQGSASAPNRWRVNGTRAWYYVTEAAFNTFSTMYGTSSDWRPGQQETWISKATYDANVTADPEHYVDTGVRHYVPISEAKDFEVVAGPGSPSNQYRMEKTYPPSGPYDGYDPAEGTWVSGKTILARLIAGDDVGIPYTPDPDGSGPNTDNAEIANMYLLGSSGWSQLADALKTVALGECGGTLTLSTRQPSGNVPDPVTYENSAAFDSTGTPIEGFKPTTVTTNAQFANRTFDFEVAGGTFITTEIRPQASSTMLRYNPGTWTCRAGATTLGSDDFEVFPITITVVNGDGSESTEVTGWTGVRVRIQANQAVSCVLTVTPK